MFNKPKTKIGGEVYVVLERGEEAEVHKTVVKSYDFCTTKGWRVCINRPVATSMYLSLRMVADNDTHISVKNVFSTEEEAKERAEVVGSEMEVEAGKQKVKALKERIKEIKSDLVEKESELSGM